jgi:predicted short-subunit dehydrogenase-like oxidoreductase (DUF2520 family)
MTKEISIVLLGSGNVAWHLGNFFKKHAFISCIFNVNINSARLLANNLNCKNYTSNYSEIPSNADLYIISVKDDKIKNIIDNLLVSNHNAVIVHTSGSTNINVLNKFKNYGIIYPLQTFSKEKTLNYNEIPFFIEGNSDYSKYFLYDFLRQYTHKIHFADSKQREKLHISAVFACNFTNYLYHIAHSILEENNLDFKIILPLIHETVNKLHRLSPLEAQTGPAFRKDNNIINKHLEQLNNHPKYKKLYKLLSETISELNNKKS